MKIEVRETEQVRNFVSALPPDQKKKLRADIRALTRDKGDIKPLVDELSGYLRLRSGRFRVIFRRGIMAGRPVRFCQFAERRDVVYELFRRMVLDDVS